jgi:hypothetical protein
MSEEKTGEQLLEEMGYEKERDECRNCFYYSSKPNEDRGGIVGWYYICNFVSGREINMYHSKGICKKYKIKKPKQLELTK